MRNEGAYAASPTSATRPLDQSDDHALADAPEEALGERFAAFAEADARLAADHCVALAFGVAFSRLGSANAAKDDRIRPIITAGVRAYRAG